MTTRKGLTLIEIILAIALMGIIAVSFISVFASQLTHIVTGSDITVDAFDDQGIFEDLIFTAKEKIQKGETLSTMPEWSAETVNVLGVDVPLQKLSYNNPANNKETNVYLSSRLAEVEIRNILTVENVLIEVSNDPSNLIADLTTAPKLNASYTDNSSQSAFYANLFRWWRTEPGVELSELVFPDDYALIPVSQSTEELDNLLDNVGANSYVVLTVTPVDIHGYRGTTVRSSNIVFVKGAEWRIGIFPWVDMNNNYDLDVSDHQLVKNSVLSTLDASVPFPNPVDPSTNLDLSDGSLFVTMRINPAISLEPGNESILVSGLEKIDWLIERNINLAKDFNVENGSDIVLKSGLGTNGGNIFLHPYVKLDASGNPIITGGVVELLDTGVSLATAGDILMETMGKGSIQFYGNADISGQDVLLRARGIININKSSIEASNLITFDNTVDPSILGSRRISLSSVDFVSSVSGADIYLNSLEDIIFKGGSWSANQTLTIPDGKRIVFEKGTARVNNLGELNLGNTAEVRFVHSMIEDLSNQMKIRVTKVSNDEFGLLTHNYYRNIGYANPLNNIIISAPNTWTNLGQGQNNIEFSASVLSGGGSLNAVKFSFDGNGILRVQPNSTTQTSLTKVKLEFRDKYANNQIKGAGIFNFSIDSSGHTVIDVEDEIPVDMYVITFNSNGGSPVDSMQKAYGDPISPPPTPTRTGYTFGGWNPALPAYMPNNNLNVEAIWTPNVYSVVLHGQGGTPDEQTLSVTYGQPYGFLGIPTRNGYTHLGWYTTASGAGTKVESTDLCLTAGDHSLYSRWGAAQYTVTFNSNGGNPPSPTSKIVTYLQPYGTLATVSRTNYTFLGWYTAVTGGNLISATSTVELIANQTLYARWSQNQTPITVTLNPDKGSVSPTSITVYFGQQYGTLPTPSRNNFNFDGWYLSNTKIINTSIVQTNSNHTLLAHWSQDPSCPFIYSFDGSDFIFEHESIPFSISRALETTSFGTLRQLKAIDGEYHVRISERLDEKSFVNAFGLKAVDYPKDAGIIDMMADIYGEPHTIKERISPKKIVNNSGLDLLEEYRSSSAPLQSNISEYETGNSVASYIFTFDKPEKDTYTANLMLKVQKTQLTTELGIHYLNKVDAKNNFWWMEDLLMLPSVNDRLVDFMSVINLKVDLWNGDNWVEQGEIEAGLDILEEFLLPVNLNQINSNEDDLKIRLRSGVGLYSIYQVAVDYSENLVSDVHELTPKIGLLNDEQDILSTINNFEDNDHIKLVKGDNIDLVYDEIALDSNLQRSFIVAVKGYYHMNADTIEKEDVLSNTVMQLKALTSDGIEGLGSSDFGIAKFQWLIALMEDTYLENFEYKVERIVREQMNELIKALPTK